MPTGYCTAGFRLMAIHFLARARFVQSTPSSWVNGLRFGPHFSLPCVQCTPFFFLAKCNNNKHTQGVWLSDYNRGADVSFNEIRFPGENGIGLSGSTQWVDGRDGNQPRHNTVQGNIIHHVGLFTKQSCAIFLAVSCLNNITGNILYHSPRALLNQNDGFGGGSRYTKNLMFAAVLETKDHGPFNSWVSFACIYLHVRACVCVHACACVSVSRV